MFSFIEKQSVFEKEITAFYTSDEVIVHTACVIDGINFTVIWTGKIHLLSTPIDDVHVSFPVNLGRCRGARLHSNQTRTHQELTLSLFLLNKRLL